MLFWIGRERENEDRDLSWSSHPPLLFPIKYFPITIEVGDIIDDGGCLTDSDYRLIVAGISENFVYLRVVDLNREYEDDIECKRPIPKREEGKYIL